MTTGLSVPIGVTPSGRASIDTGDSHLAKIIALALSDVDSENPFKTLPQLPLIFDINEGSIVNPIVRHRVISLFQRLESEERAKLVEESLAFSNVEGELVVEFNYINLKLNRPTNIKGRYDLATGRFILQ